MFLTFLGVVIVVVVTAQDTTPAATWTMCAQHPTVANEVVRMIIAEEGPASVEILLNQEETLCMASGYASIYGSTRVSMSGLRFCGNEDCLRRNFDQSETFFGIYGDQFDRSVPASEVSLLVTTFKKNLPMNELRVSANACPAVTPPISAPAACPPPPTVPSVSVYATPTPYRTRRPTTPVNPPPSPTSYEYNQPSGQPKASNSAQTPYDGDSMMHRDFVVLVIIGVAIFLLILMCVACACYHCSNTRNSNFPLPSADSGGHPTATHAFSYPTVVAPVQGIVVDVQSSGETSQPPPAMYPHGARKTSIV